MTRYALGIQYDGSDLHGWQRQAHDPTVQGLLETAISTVANHPITLTVAGRTDAGVHATGQVAAFESSKQRELYEWQRGVNALTPRSIGVSWVSEVSAAFHPRYDATARRYLYIFYDATKNPFLDRLAWVTGNLDADLMHRQSQLLVGEHDFTSFRASGCQSRSPMRRVNRCEVRRVGSFVVLDIEANAFVLHMVRNIARALADIGAGKDTRTVDALLRGRDRSKIGATAPPCGLYLYHVTYPGEAFPHPLLPPVLAAMPGGW